MAIERTVTTRLKFSGSVTKSEIAEFVANTDDSARFTLSVQKGDRSYESDYYSITATWNEPFKKRDA